MRCRSNRLRCLAALGLLSTILAGLISAQTGSTGVPPRPPVGPKLEVPGRPTTHIPRPIPPPNP